MTCVSVVIPTYNRPQFLPRAIETARNQTLTDNEIIVVDDGSDTGYANEVVANYSDSVRCVCHDKNLGLSAARNTGIDYAIGEYVAFLDDDDLWHKRKLATQVQALENEPEAVLASCRTASITPSGSILRCEGPRPDGDLSGNILLGNVIGSPSRVLVRGETVESIQFDESLRTKQDWDFYIRLCQHGTVVSISEWYCFRVIHESMSSDPEAAARDIGRVIEKHQDRIESAGTRREVTRYLQTNVGRAYIEYGQYPQARRHLLKAMLTAFSAQPALLYALSFAPDLVVRQCLDVKRWAERQIRGCQGISLDHGVELTRD